MHITTQQNDSVDEICWRILGRSAGVTEQVYNINIGLAAMGPLLPEGIIITLPDSSAAAPIRREIIQLWS